MRAEKKENIRNAVLLVIVLILAIIGSSIEYSSLKVGAHENKAINNPYGEPFKIRCTLYTDKGLTASGQETRDGIVAGKREWLGMTANIYSINEDGSIGQLIGIYEFLDTGYGIRKTDSNGNTYGTIERGESIDVWVPDMNAVREWQQKYGDYIFLQVFPSYG